MPQISKIVCRSVSSLASFQILYERPDFFRRKITNSIFRNRQMRKFAIVNNNPQTIGFRKINVITNGIRVTYFSTLVINFREIVRINKSTIGFLR